METNQRNNIPMLCFVFLTAALTMTFFFSNKNPEIALTIVCVFGLLIINSTVKDFKDLKIANIIEISKHEIKEKVKEDLKNENSGESNA